MLFKVFYVGNYCQGWGFFHMLDEFVTFPRDEQKQNDLF